MPYTPNYLLNIPTPGDPAQLNAWGAMENTGRTLVDTALGGVFSLSIAGSGITILTSVAGITDQSRYAHYIFTGVLTGSSTVLWPQNCGRMFSVTNSTTGAFTLQLGANNGAGAAGGTTVTIPQGISALVYSDGTNVGLRHLGFAAVQPGPVTFSGVFTLGNNVGALTMGDGSAACNAKLFSNDPFVLRLFNGLSSLTYPAIMGLDNTGAYLQFSNGAGGNLARIDQITGAYTAVSDARRKTVNPQQVDYRAALNALWLGDFTWNETGTPSFGPLAQQAYEALGGLGVTKPNDPDDPYTVDPAIFGYLGLWLAKKLSEENDSLKARLAAIEAKIGI